MHAASRWGADGLGLRHAAPGSTRPIGVLILLAFGFLVVSALMYVGAGYLDFEDDSEQEVAYKAQHRTHWAITRSFHLAATLLLAAGITAFAARLDHPLAWASAAVFLIGSASGAIIFTASAQSSLAAWYAENGSVPDWAPAYRAISAAMWELWYVASYLGLVGLAVLMLFLRGPKSAAAWVTIALAPYGYFFGSIPGNVFLAALPFGVQALMNRMPPPDSHVGMRYDGGG